MNTTQILGEALAKGEFAYANSNPAQADFMCVALDRYCVGDDSIIKLSSHRSHDIPWGKDTNHLTLLVSHRQSSD